MLLKRRAFLFFLSSFFFKKQKPGFLTADRLWVLSWIHIGIKPLAASTPGFFQASAPPPGRCSAATDLFQEHEEKLPSGNQALSSSLSFEPSRHLVMRVSLWRDTSSGPAAVGAPWTQPAPHGVSSLADPAGPLDSRVMADVCIQQTPRVMASP